MMPDLSVNIGKLKLKNPVMVASGTFGYAEEFRDFIDLEKLGAIVTKTITLRARQGNPMPRTCETPQGLINSIGLENPGIESFIRDKLPFLKKLKVPVIVSVASEGGFGEFFTLVRRLGRIEEVAAIELNISCPNIRGSKQRALSEKLISQDADMTHDLVRAVRRVTRKTLITKLSPNVSSISDIARAAEKGGSDALSLINTLSAMSIDLDSRRPRIAAVTGGLSGPAIRPVAVRMVWEVSQKVKIPIIGMGGIVDTASALEFIIAGAAAVAVGTANFTDPGVTVEIIDGINKYMVKNKIRGLRGLKGSVRI
ncbi:MAG: dihydroorotate dehydrogenase [Candidatus Omnitrophica bacterium]|nr:dihydroorotate dehydrogenase [Candidatus Omnitrophota bacterium]MDD5654407.1 dihydroorotate dehydrogenase [Candidatus Omnitrophota bacterium]